MNFSVVIYYDDDPERLLSAGGDPCLAISQTLGPCRGASSRRRPLPEIFSPWIVTAQNFTKSTSAMILFNKAFTKKKLGTLPPNTLMCSPFLCNLYQAIIWIIPHRSKIECLHLSGQVKQGRLILVQLLLLSLANTLWSYLYSSATVFELKTAHLPHSSSAIYCNYATVNSR